MTRDEDIKKIVDRWKDSIPSEVRMETAWKVAKAHFPESEKRKKRGSHHHIVIWKRSVKLAKDLGLPGLDPFNYKGELLIPAKGNKVRGHWIKVLVEAIELEERFGEED